MKRGINYIWVREGTEIYYFKKILRDYYIEVGFKRHHTMSFLINSQTDKEPLIISRNNKRDKDAYEEKCVAQSFGGKELTKLLPC